MSELVIRTSTPPGLGEHFSPVGLMRSIWTHRRLIGNFASRELSERHKGAMLGMAWNVLNPLLTLAVYTVVFGYIFGQRWDKGNLPDKLDFPLTFFAGNILFHVFVEAANRAPTLVSGKSNLVRKVVFPLEILPVAAVWAGCVQALITTALLLAVLGLVGGLSLLHWQIVLLPVVMLPLVMISLGTAWALSAVGVFIRDLRHVVVVCTQLLMFMTPLFYKVDRIPESHPWLRAIIEHNPMSVIVESGRRVLLWGEAPDWIALQWTIVFGAAVMLGGHFVFSAMRRSMADVH
jgi:lipopolysaccharide transport system permease protein